MQRYRQAIHAGRPPLGAHVAGTEAARVVAALVAEDYTKAQIAAWLGQKYPALQVPRRHGADVTVRTILRLRVIQRRVCG